MTGFVVHDLTGTDVVVRVVRDMPPLSAELDRQIEDIWRKASERVEAGGAGRLFNGRVFSVDAITRTSTRLTTITGHMSEYRRLVAQSEDHALFSLIGVRSLAVCGVLRCRDGVVIGRRPAAAIYQPGMWQLTPAGSVDNGALAPDGTMDLCRQILTELREEVGIPANLASEPQTICVVEHPGSHVCDLGMAITTSLDAAGVHLAHEASGNEEYDPLVVVPDHELQGFVDLAGPALVPPAREFLARLRLLPARYALSKLAGASAGIS